MIVLSIVGLIGLVSIIGCLIIVKTPESDDFEVLDFTIKYTKEELSIEERHTRFKDWMSTHNKEYS